MTERSQTRKAKMKYALIQTKTVVQSARIMQLGRGAHRGVLKSFKTAVARGAAKRRRYLALEVLQRQRTHASTASLEAEVETVNRSIANLQTNSNARIASLEAEVETANRSFANLQTNSNARIASLEAEVETANRSVANLQTNTNARIAYLEESLDNESIASRIAKFANRLPSL